MFPSIDRIGHEDVIEDHRTEPDQDQLSHIPNTKRCVKTIRFQRLPMCAVLVAKCRHIVAKNVAKESKLETFVKRVRGENHDFVSLKNQDLAALGIPIDRV